MRTFFGMFLLILAIIPFVAGAEVIRDFSVEVEIDSDGQALVHESILYDFEDSQRRGIFRFVPYAYDTGESVRLTPIEIVEVSRDGGGDQFSLDQGKEFVSLRIGNPDVYLSGQHLYEITYVAKNIINPFEGFNEFNWNVTGHGWEVPVEKASLTLSNENLQTIQSSCYVGILGSDEGCVADRGGNVYLSGRELSPKEGFTVALGFPAEYFEGLVINTISYDEHGYVPEKISTQDSIKNFLGLWFYFLQFGLVVLTFFLMRWIYKKKGINPPIPKPIIAQYEPPKNMNPIHVGTAIDGKVDPQDISAHIIFLAQQGYLKIINDSKKIFGFTKKIYKFERTKKKEGLTNIDRDVLSILFSADSVAGQTATMDEIKSKRSSLQNSISNVEKTLEDQMVKMGLHNKDKKMILIPGIFAAFALFFVSPVSSFIIFFFLAFISPRTKKGSSVRAQIMGLERYITVAEKDRINFHNSPDKKPEEFLRLLPYAIALGVEEKWAKNFKDITIPEQEWYTQTGAAAIASGASISNGVNNFDISSLTDSVSSFTSSMSKSFSSSTASSSGGGFSGGGAGGGGGGSW